MNVLNKTKWDFSMWKVLMLIVIVLMSFVFGSLSNHHLSLSYEARLIINIGQKIIPILFWYGLTLYLLDPRKPKKISFLYLIPMTISLIQIPLLQIILEHTESPFYTALVALSLNVLRTITFFTVIIMDYKFEKKTILVVLVVSRIIYYILPFSTLLGLPEVLIGFDIWEISQICRSLLLLIFLSIELRYYLGKSYSSIVTSE